jgi:hypothetical protein
MSLMPLPTSGKVKKSNIARLIDDQLKINDMQPRTTLRFVNISTFL